MIPILDVVRRPVEQLRPLREPAGVAVVVPVLNSRQWIGQCLDSIIDQQGVRTEIIVMDGGSTDGTLDVLNSYGDAIDILVSGSDAGQSDALKSGFDLSTLEYLAWLNADDLLTPGSLQRSVAALQHSGAGLVYGDYLVLHERSGSLVYKPKVSFDRFICGLSYCMVPQPGSVFRRDAYQRVGGIDPSYSYSMDLDLFLRLGLDFEAVHLAVPQAIFRVHEGSKSSVRIDRFASENRRIRRQVFGTAWDTKQRKVLQSAALLRLALRFARQRRYVPVRKDRSFA